MIFFRDPHLLLGDAPRRAYSLGSEAVLASLDCGVMQAEHGLALEEEVLQIALYDFIHTAPLREVRFLTNVGDWRQGFADVRLSATTVASFRVMAAEVRALLRAVDFRVRAREEDRRAAEREPADAKRPFLLAVQLRRLARCTGWARDFILWHLPLWEARALLHAAAWDEGRLTVMPGDGEPTPEDLRPEWMAFDTPAQSVNGCCGDQTELVQL